MIKLIFFLFLYSFICFSQRISVDHSNNMFIDNYNRVRIFHGVNVVYKTFPYHPNIESFDPLYSLSSKDINNFKEWGFNIVRLGVLWVGVEPNHNQFNETYINIIKSIISNLEDNNIYTMIDAHQDVWSREFCGEGAPNWTIDLPSSIKSFPIPVYNKYTTNNGIPSINDCISSPFWPYYYAESVSYIFQALYDNINNLQDEMCEFWEYIAYNFKDYKTVIGYDLINEPWPGNIYSNPKLLSNPISADIVNLMPLYKNLTKAIRNVDNNTIIMYEPMGTDYATPVGFYKLPDPKSALNYHVYCGLVNVSGIASNFSECIQSWDNEMNIRMNDVKRLNTVGIMSEFGDLGSQKSSLDLLEHYVNEADKWFQSTMYWQYKFYNDLTTQTPIEGLYYFNGTLNESKIKILSRTYAYAIAGNPIKMTFNSKTSSFILSYIININILLPTEIYLNENIYYSNGFSINFSPSIASWKRIEDKNYIAIILDKNIQDKQLLTITIDSI